MTHLHKTISIVICCLLSGTVLLAQYRPLINEAPDPNVVPETDWTQVSKGLYAGVGSIDERYAKYMVPQNLKESIHLKGWRGETVASQLVLWAGSDVEAVSCQLSDLKAKRGKEKISAKNIGSRFVSYTLTDTYIAGCKPNITAEIDSSLVADALVEASSVDMAARSVRPLWLRVHIPRNVAAGEYTGIVTLKAKQLQPITLPLTLSVAERELPEPGQWAFHLDLWQNPYAVARWFEVEPWSKEHFKRLRPELELLASAGQKCVTVTLNNRPWGGQTYDAFGSMIAWHKKQDGSWHYDFSIFDRWVSFALDCGIGPQINCYTMVPWGNTFYYFDEALQKEVSVTMNPGTDEYTAFWKPFLTRFVAHLKSKGWYHQTTIAMDERSKKDMMAVYQLIQEVSPDLKIALAADHWFPELSDNLFDFCASSRFTFPTDLLERRRAQGQKTTYYTCCVEAYPNTFTFSPPAESAWLGWYTAARGLDGYLRWAYNSWTENPYRDSRFRRWPAGDTYLTYPGGASSIRFERLREGIQDYEKIGILRRELSDCSNEEAAVLLQRLDDLLESFTIERIPQETARKMIKKGKALLEEMEAL
ncbi:MULTISPECIES: glycoside hydrolase domain-containing protein [unclassified Carboxylicivirga]|uniref:DUF4091 domain-containing protein n=1 Tax=Carboxylicivirga TaxID=1628153 RepID=UPI003D343950